jgi:hypothetical protein
MGSSIVRMWQERDPLMWLIMAAVVVVFPEEVGPVTRTSPRCSFARDLTTGGSPKVSKAGLPGRTRRTAIETLPR